MLYPLLQATLTLSCVLIGIGCILYLLRAQIARLAGRMQKRTHLAQQEIKEEYHNGLEEEGE